MKVAAVPLIKSSLGYIKENFWGIWLMFLKIPITILPGLLIIALGGGSLLLTGLLTMNHSNPSLFLELLHAPVLILGILVMLMGPFLGSAAMTMNILQSIVRGEPLNKSILRRMFQKEVLVYFMWMGLLLLATVCLIALPPVLLMVFCGPVGMFLSIFYAVGAFSFLLLRTPLLYVGLAVDPQKSLKDLVMKTKGQMFGLFKIFLLGILVMIVLQLLFYVPITLLPLAGALVGHGMLMAIIGGIVGIISMLIMIPLQQIFLVGFGYQYKNIDA